MKYKSDAPSTWMMMIASVKSLGNIVSCMRIDNDSVFMSKDFIAACATYGIIVERTFPYARWQLGII